MLDKEFDFLVAEVRTSYLNKPLEEYIKDRFPELSEIEVYSIQQRVREIFNEEHKMYPTPLPSENRGNFMKRLRQELGLPLREIYSYVNLNWPVQEGWTNTTPFKAIYENEETLSVVDDTVRKNTLVLLKNNWQTINEIEKQLYYTRKVYSGSPSTQEGTFIRDLDNICAALEDAMIALRSAELHLVQGKIEKA